MIKLRTLLLQNKVFIFLLLLSLTYTYLYIKLYDYNSNYSLNDTHFEVKIINYKIDGNKLCMTLKGLDTLKGNYYFKDQSELEYFKNNYSINDFIEINGELSIPKNNTIPNTFNYKEYLKYNKIYYLLKINDYKLISKNNNIFYSIKNFMYERISKTKNNEYLYAFVLGVSSYLDSDINSNYKINGITHLFALSGLHVSIISSIVHKLLKKFKCNEKISLIIETIFLLLLCFIASFTPSILRATILFILSSLNKIYYFFIRPVNLLYLTFIVMMIINPFYIYNLGFQLSFSITFFILLFSENNNKTSVLSTSFISFLGSIPILVNNFYSINILSFINNIFFIPYVSYIVYPFSLVVTVVPFLSKILLILTNIMEYISKLSVNVLNINIIIPKLPIILIIIFYMLLISYIKKKKKVLLVLLLCIVVINTIVKKTDNTSFLCFLDVGQGDSIVIKIKNKVIMIDTGGVETYYEEEWKKKNNTFNLMEKSIIPYLNSIGIDKIDYLIITHGDYDHIGNAVYLVNNIKVGEVILNNNYFNNLEKNLIEVLKSKSVAYRINVKSLNIENNIIYFLNDKIYDNENDNSNVLYLDFYNNKVLLMGDAGTRVEKEIIKKYNLENISILKVGHHGSSTSSSKEFINTINPMYSIISVGNKNKYGHPKKTVLDILNDSKIYRTDKDGTIIYKYINNIVKIEKFSP